MHNVLISLVREAIIGEKATLEDCDFKALYSLSVKHDLAPIVAFALENHEISDKDAASAFTHQKQLAIYRRGLLDYDFSSVCSLFDSEKIDYIPLKGAIVKSLYPEAYLRTSCDNDILIRNSDKERALTLLTERLNYTTDHIKDKDISLISPRKMNTELHFALCEGDSKYASLLNKAWDFAMLDSECRYSLTNEFFVLYHIAHMAAHMHDGGCGIRPFIDLYLFNSRVGCDEKILMPLLSSVGLCEFYNSSNELISVWLGENEHTELTKMLEEFIISGGSYGTRENMASAKQAQSGGRAKYILSRIFMPRAKLAKYYPQVEKHALLVPFYQVKRWCRLLKSDTRKMAKSELNATASKKDLFTMMNL